MSTGGSCQCGTRVWRWQGLCFSCRRKLLWDLALTLGSIFTRGGPGWRNAPVVSRVLPIAGALAICDRVTDKKDRSTDYTDYTDERHTGAVSIENQSIRAWMGGYPSAGHQGGP